MKTNNIITVISDYHIYGEYDLDNKKKVTVYYLITPCILGIEELHVIRAGQLLNDVSDPNLYYLTICIGNDISVTHKTFYFTTKDRAEACRDSILEAIDQYWMNVT